MPKTTKKVQKTMKKAITIAKNGAGGASGSAGSIRRALAAPGVLDNSCGSSCRRPDMLVMSLSPLLGQAIPDIAETAEIVVLPRQGPRSGNSRVPKPQG